MTDRPFVARTRLVYGAGSLARLGDLARELGFQRTLLVLDGRTNWFEGVQLLAIYAILAVAFYFM